MEENKIAFYHSKGKLFLGTVFSLVLICIGVLILYIAFIDASIFMIALALFIIILFSCFFVASILKMTRGYPYITITDEYIQLDSHTRSEATIYYTDIENIKVFEVSFQKMMEIILYDEDDYFDQLSLHNKVRLCMNRVFRISLYTINAKAIRKQERPTLFKTLDLVIQEKIKQRSSAPIIETAQKHNVDTDFLEKYDPTTPVDRSIDKSYFLDAYGYGFALFSFSFILFYLLTSQNNDYLFYIIMCFFLFPFAKVLIDWLFGFKLKHAVDKQKGITYYLYQLMYMFDFFLFHVSLLVAPIGILFLLIRYIVIRIKR